MTVDLLRSVIPGFKTGAINDPDPGSCHVIMNHDPGHRELFPARPSVVLVREPLQCIASFFKHELKVTNQYEDNIDAFKQFASRMADFWVSFMCEYAYSSPVEKPVKLFGYDRILASPLAYLRHLSKMMGPGVTFDPHEALSKVPVKRRSDHSTYKYYRQDPSIVQSIKRTTFPIATLLTSRGII